MVNFALIGVSGFGAIHYDDILREYSNKRINFVAATIINQEEEAEKCQFLRSIGTEIFVDYRTMLNKYAGRIDVCCIPTGIALHAPMAIAALEAGANVLLEKPAAATVQDIQLIQDAEIKYKKFTAVGFQQLYRPEIIQLKKDLVAGLIGKITEINFKGIWPRDLKYYTRNNWAGRLQQNNSWVLDSPFNNAMAHHIMMSCFLGGVTLDTAVTPLAIKAELYRANNIESADTASIMLDTAENINCHFSLSHASNQMLADTINVIGKNGSITIINNKITIKTSMSCVDIPLDTEIVRAQLMQAVAAKAAGGNQFICTLGLAKIHTLCVNGAHDSSVISNINPDYIYQENTADSTQVAVKGINDAVEQSIKQHKMLSEICPQCFKGNSRTINLRNYAKFPGEQP
jgi:predicted dehydrogenase